VAPRCRQTPDTHRPRETRARLRWVNTLAAAPVENFIDPARSMLPRWRRLALAAHMRCPGLRR